MKYKNNKYSLLYAVQMYVISYMLVIQLLSSYTYSLSFASALFNSSVFPVVVIFLSKMSGYNVNQLYGIY